MDKDMKYEVVTHLLDIAYELLDDADKYQKVLDDCYLSNKADGIFQVVMAIMGIDMDYGCPSEEHQEQCSNPEVNFYDKDENCKKCINHDNFTDILIERRKSGKSSEQVYFELELFIKERT
jgi:hypothetical protein